MADHRLSARVQKRMRKGTKSCFECRRRKVRCLYDGERGPCVSCQAHGDKCTPQGIVPVDLSFRNKVLEDRVAQLELQLGEAARPPAKTPLQDVPADDVTTSQALEHLLAGIQEAAVTPSSRSVEEGNVAERHDTISSTVEDPVRTAAAPLVRLLDTRMFGGTPEDQHHDGDGHSVPQDNQHQARSFRKSRKYLDAVRGLCSRLPSASEMAQIFATKASWWPLYREAFDLVWGNGDEVTFEIFAIEALKSGHPAKLGLLLVCFAIGTGDFERFTPPVDRYIVSDDEFAGTEAGLQCLMALGLCNLVWLRPRNAWSIYRRANTLVQLLGWHLNRQGDERRENLFWQLFHADRWVALMVGLPYGVVDGLQDLRVAPLGEIPVGKWSYRHLGVVSGRVIDHIQGVKGPSVASALEIEDSLESIRSQLPSRYVDLEDARACTDLSEKSVRLYRIIEFYQLRAYAHLPLMLKSASEHRFDFSRASCLADSRVLLDAYFELYDSSPTTVSDGAVLNFTAFTHAVIIMLGMLSYGQSRVESHYRSSPHQEQDRRRIDRTLEVLQYGSKCDISWRLCQHCYTALDSLMHSARNPDITSPRRVKIPFFGIILLAPSQTLGRSKEATTSSTTATTTAITASYDAARRGGNKSRDDVQSRRLEDEVNGYNESASTSNTMQQQDLDFNHALTYQGPFLPYSNNTAGLADDATLGTDMEWSNDVIFNADWDWLTADIPPNVFL